MNKNVWFARHAESVTNSGGLWRNPFTNPITEKGTTQAIRLARVFNEKPTLIVTSPYIRTKQTAQPVFERWPDIPHEEWEVQEFTQICHMSRTIDSYQQRIEIRENIWNTGDPDFSDGPGAESFNNLKRRVNTTIENIKAAASDKILIFTHSFFIRTLIYQLANSDLKSISIDGFRDYINDIRIPNTAVLHCVFDENGNGKIIQLISSHLEWAPGTNMMENPA